MTGFLNSSCLSSFVEGEQRLIVQKHVFAYLYNLHGPPEHD
ncbi:MAG: hypothetical protein NVS4B9_38140 [Ktedonobacteraceae bacterium]